MSLRWQQPSWHCFRKISPPFSQHSGKGEHHSTHWYRRENRSADSGRFHTPWRLAYPRRNERQTCKGRTRRSDVSRGIRDTERRRASERASELRVRAALSRLSGSALGTESGEREAPSDFRGIHCHPYRRGGRYPCSPLSATRVLRFPLPRRPHHRAGASRHPRASPLLVRHPTRFPPVTPWPSAPERRTTPP